MAWFRRKGAGGRHVLGAAVTSIPSGPLTASLPPPPAAPVVRVPPADVVRDAIPAPQPAGDLEAARVPAFESALLTSVAELISSGQAWAEPLAVTPEPPAGPDLPPAAALAPELPPAPALAPELAPIREPAGQHMAAAGSARSSSESALAELLPQQGDPAPGPRVQLGFRDGTSTTLDPASSQSLALEHLAQSLTRRD